MKSDKNSKWDVKEIPPQNGRTMLITGTAGIGYETALVLARAGAEVIIAGRDKDKGRQALNDIYEQVPSAKISFEIIDLASIESIKQFGQRLRSKRKSLDVLINNAGIMTPPKRLETVNGFEIQFGTNYVGPFLLTSELLPLLRNGNKPLVVTVCSIANRSGVINFDDLQSRQEYKPTAAYNQSKLADLMFALELEHRSQIAGWGISSIPVHPGVANTNLTVSYADKNSFATKLTKWLISLLATPPAEGAWPTLFAVTSPAALPGVYYGPSKFSELRGIPAAAKIPAQALDQLTAQRLWEVTEELIGIRFGTYEEVKG